MGLTQTWNLMDMLLRKRKLLEKIKKKKKKKAGQRKKIFGRPERLENGVNRSE